MSYQDDHVCFQGIKLSQSQYVSKNSLKTRKEDYSG